MKLVDMTDSKSVAARRVGSSPTTGTTLLAQVEGAMSDIQPIQSRSHQVFIDDLSVNTVIGVYDWERTIDQTLIISAQIDHDFSLASKTDAISDALDYNQVCQKITRVCHDTQASLLEHLAERLGNMIINEFCAQRVTITIKKPTAVKAAASVGVKAEFFR